MGSNILISLRFQYPTRAIMVHDLYFLKCCFEDVLWLVLCTSSLCSKYANFSIFKLAVRLRTSGASKNRD